MALWLWPQVGFLEIEFFLIIFPNRYDKLPRCDRRLSSRRGFPCAGMALLMASGRLPHELPSYIGCGAGAAHFVGIPRSGREPFAYRTGRTIFVL